MTQILIEKISSSDLKEIFTKYSCNKIFLVTGKSSYRHSGAKDFIESAIEGIEYVQFSEFEQNPKFDDAIRGVEIYKQSNCDMIIAIGGGSVMDMAKLINVFSSNSHIDSLEIVQNPKLISNKGKTLVAIPTTAGTGSEATHFAVVYHNKKKYSVAHDFIMPDIVGLNSIFSFSQSKYLTACSGLDALSQAIESYWSVGATNESKNYAKEAIQLLIQYLEECVISPNVKSRDAVIHAAYLAGKAINISKTTAAHAISYAFTTYFSIPHGHAVFLTLPEFFEYNKVLLKKDMNDPRGLNYNKKNIEELCKLLQVKNETEGKLFLKEYAEKIEVELSFSKLGIKDFENLIVRNVNIERLSNNPRNVSEKELIEILKSKKV